jgi:cyclophilin family peptidyl-prolyl cis-trans isomerase
MIVDGLGKYNVPYSSYFKTYCRHSAYMGTRIYRVIQSSSTILGDCVGDLLEQKMYFFQMLPFSSDNSFTLLSFRITLWQ